MRQGTRDQRQGTRGRILKYVLPLFVPVLFAGVQRFPDAPPPAHTGGFGEPTCLLCHFDGELNPPGGRLSLMGLEEDFVPGKRHQLNVLLDKDDMERAGFQLAIRYADGRQAGTLSPLDTRVDVDTSEGVQYAQHTLEGVMPLEQGRAQWVIEWLAPQDTAGIVVHLAANAADGDESPFGDAIYQQEW